ncbi:class I SAM-dependent methyltransferase [Streptomyces sp. NPDC048416]|uniref:class I SAM-dependent methyltransferase n=1 Tax=Streptomyces sp. NPDC048416 TaxID=3365546 RepID=UPI0037212E8B
MEGREPVIGDAFGEVLQRCWSAGARPGTVFEVLERSDGAVWVSDTYHWFTPPERWPAPERWACKYASGRVLDIGCGSGRHALVLADQGLDVIGLDPSPGAVAVAGARGVTVVEGGIDDVERLGLFDTILLLGNNLGLLRSGSEASDLLSRIARVARPGAQILASSRDPHAVRDPIEIAYQEWNRSAGRLPGQERFRIRHRNTATPWFDYLFVSLDELTELIADSPWVLDDSFQERALYSVRLLLKDSGT